MEKTWELQYLEHLLEWLTPSIYKDTVNYHLSELFQKVSELEVSAEVLHDRINFCIEALPAAEKEVLFRIRREGMNVSTASKSLELTREKCRILERLCDLHMSDMQSCNILLYGIEDGTKKNNQLKESILSKIQNKDSEFSLEERMYLSVLHARIEYNARNALTRAGIEDFSVLLKDGGVQLFEYKGIGVGYERTIKSYLQKEFGLA